MPIPCETIQARDLGISQIAILCRWPNDCCIDFDVSLEKIVVAYEAEIEPNHHISSELMANANTEDTKCRFSTSQRVIVSLESKY